MSSAATARLPATALTEAAEKLSVGGRYHFTTRQLHYELWRSGAAPLGLAEPGEGPFEEEVRAHEAEHGPLPGRIRPDRSLLDVSDVAAPEVLDFAVTRILVFERLDLFLFFVMNGFYRRIEVGLVLWPEQPSYVWRSVTAQLRGGVKTTFYGLHDADRSGYRLRESLKRALADHGSPNVVNLGLTFAQATHAGLPVRSAGGDTVATSQGTESEATLLEGGGHAHLEELAPLALLRWTYGRVAKGHEEIGFG